MQQARWFVGEGMSRKILDRVTLIQRLGDIYLFTSFHGRVSL